MNYFDYWQNNRDCYDVTRCLFFEMPHESIFLIHVKRLDKDRFWHIRSEYCHIIVVECCKVYKSDYYLPIRPERVFSLEVVRLYPISQSTCLRCHVFWPIRTMVTDESEI